MGQTDDIMMKARPHGGYMYTPITRGHKPTPSQESNTLSEVSCTTTISMDSGPLRNNSPTYHEEEEEDNRLQDFHDEDDAELLRQDEDDNAALSFRRARNHGLLSASRDDLALPGAGSPNSGARTSRSDQLLGNNNSDGPIVKLDPASQPDLRLSHPPHNNINNNNHHPSHSHYQPHSSLHHPHHIHHSSHTHLGASNSNLSERSVTLSDAASSRGIGGFRDSCDTVVKVCVTTPCSCGGGNSVGSSSSCPAAASRGRCKSLQDETDAGMPRDSKSANSDYGSFCATPTGPHTAAGPTDRVPVQANDASPPSSSGNTGSGRPHTTSTPYQQVQNICPDDTDNSLKAGDSYQRAPLLTDSEPEDEPAGHNPSAPVRGGSGDRGGPVKLTLPASPHSGSGDAGLAGPDDPIPSEPLKTLLSALFLGTGFVATTASLAITHESVPEIEPLPDVILDNVAYQQWGLSVSEILIMISTITACLVVLLHCHRLIILRRIWFLLGCLYYYRAITMFITVLPKADPSYTCNPKLDNTTALPALVIAKRVLILISGMGLSINGKHIYCGDYIFSGHTMVLTMGYLVIKEYSPRRFFVLHWMSFLTSATGIVMLLIARGHYSIDCLIAYYITTRMWWIYHTLANNNSLKSKGNHNFLDQMWWWLIFRYFERRIGSPLPRRYGLPLPRRLRRYLKSILPPFCMGQQQQSNNNNNGSRPQQQP